jgi:hypothetical protein
MCELNQKILSLKTKKALLYSNIESLSDVNDSLYLQFGKVAAELMKHEKELVRETKNTFDAN